MKKGQGKSSRGQSLNIKEEKLYVPQPGMWATPGWRSITSDFVTGTSD